MAMSFPRKLYGALLVIRALLALCGTGYIHPDEHFQNGEVTAGPILGFHTFLTWEWDKSFPVRSVMPPYLTTGLPYVLLSLIGTEHYPAFVFLVERVTFLLLSFLLDYVVYTLVPNPMRYQALILLASSHTIHTFQVRSFSNSIEAVFLALALIAYHKFLQAASNNSIKSQHIHALSVLFVLGTFTRVTFIAFALPIALQTFYLLFRLEVPIATATLPFITATVTSLICIFIDTAYFHSSLNFTLKPQSMPPSLRNLTSFIFNLSVTPLNFVSYNLNSENLAEHGLHPRWLHLFVNLPLVIGLGLVWYGFREGVTSLRSSVLRETKVIIDRKGQRKKIWQRGAALKYTVNVTQCLNKTLTYIITTSLTLLSFQPHQEPRFLTPLLVPFIVLTANIRIRSKFFWTTWTISNIILALLFGTLHQAGVVPSLCHLHEVITADLAKNETVQVVYWKTYMPPRRFMGVPQAHVQNGRLSIIDLGGAPSSELLSVLSNPPSYLDPNFKVVTYPSQHSITKTYVVAPLHSRVQLPCCSTLRRSFFPHLDLDHIGESMEAGWYGLGLGLFAWEDEHR